MKIVKLGWGLGNQMLQYTFGRYIEAVTGEMVYFDDSYFFRHKEHNKYKIEGNEILTVFNQKLNLLSRCFSSDVWNELVENSKMEGMYRTLRRYNDDLLFVSESWIKNKNTPQYDAPEQGYEDEKWLLAPTNRFLNKLAFIPGDVYYMGIWVNRMWFYNIENIMRNEFLFSKINDDENKELLKKINTINSVGIHIRHGGLLSNKMAVSPKWYSLAVKHFRSLVKNPVFFLFSDNPDWCKSNLDKIGIKEEDDVTVVCHNKGENSYRDMQLMTQCKNLIISNATFGFWSALLNVNPDKIILSPDQHYFNLNWRVE